MQSLFEMTVEDADFIWLDRERNSIVFYMGYEDRETYQIDTLSIEERKIIHKWILAQQKKLTEIYNHVLSVEG